MSKITLGNDIVKENSTGINLTDGAYPAVIVGVFLSMKAPFDEEKDNPYQAIRFAFQLIDDDGNAKVQQSNDMRITFSNKSTLFKQLSAWCKSSSPTELWENLKKIGIVVNEQLDYEKFLGKHVQLMVTMKQSKKDTSVFYPEFQFSAPKKGQTMDPVTEKDKLVPIWTPKFISDEDILDTVAIDGFEWKRGEKKDADNSGSSDRPSRDNLETQVPAQSEKTNAPKKVVKTSTVPSKSESESDLPF